MEDLFKLKQAIANLEDREVRQLLLLLFMKANEGDGAYEEEVMEIAHSLIATFKEQADEIHIENVHIVFSEASASNLKQAFRQTNMVNTEAVIYLPDRLSIGPIAEVHTLQGIEQRYQWFIENFHVEEVIKMKETFIQAIKDIYMIKNREKIIIWTSQNAHEQTGLRIVLALLQNHMNAITIINSFESFHQLYNFPQMQEEGMPRLTEDLIAEQLLYIYNRTKHIRLSNDVRGALCEAGFEILATDSVLRSWTNGRIVHEDETRDDAYLLSYVQNRQGKEERFVRASRIIADLGDEMEQYTGGEWLDYRLRMLVAKGYLQYKGDLSSARLYEVKC